MNGSRAPLRPAPDEDLNASPADYDVAPGDLIQDELDARGLSQAELAARTGLSAKHINQVIKRVVPLSTDTALLIERALDIPAHLLTAVEARYQAHRARARSRQGLAQYRDWLAEFPLGRLADERILDRSSPIADQVEQVLAFFAVADPDAFHRVYDGEKLSFRRAQHLDVDPKATAVWLRLAEREARRQDPAPFDRDTFRALLDRLPDLTLQPIRDGLPELQHQCAAAGVAVVYEPDVPGAHACAATRWIGAERVVIAVSGRGQFEDMLWFSFFHECAHVLLHPKRRSIVHLADGKSSPSDDADGAETAADALAADYLLRHEDPVRLDALRTHAQVRAFATEIGVDPGIVAGRIAHDRGGSAWQKYRALRRKIEI